MNSLKANPIKYFSIITIVSVTMGFSVKYFLKSSYLNNFVKQQLLVSNSDHTKMGYKTFSIYISKKHLLPTIVLEVNKLSLIILDKCDNEVTLLANEITTPINLFMAIWKKRDIKFNIEIDHLLVNNKKLTCVESLGVENSKKVSRPLNSQQYLNSLIARYPSLTKLSNKISKKVRKADVRTLELNNIDYFKSSVFSKIRFNNLAMSFNDDNSLIKIYSQVDWDSFYRGKKRLHIPKFRLVLNKDNISMSLLGKFNEGHLSVQSQVNMKRMLISSNVSFKQLPLSEVNQILSNIGFDNLNLTSQLSWLSCKIRMSSPVESFFSSLHTIDKCQVVGEVGEWKLAKYNFKITPMHLQPNNLYLKVKKSRIKKIIELFNDSFALDYISRFGLFTGNVKLSPNSSSWQVEGQVKNARIQFDLLEKNYEQLIRSVDVSMRGVEDGFTLKSSNFRMKEGRLVGQINYKFVTNDRVGLLNIDLDELSLASKLQDKILFGKTSFSKVIGTGAYESGKLSLNANLKSDGYESKYMKAGPYNLSLKVKRKQVSGEVNFTKLTVLPSAFSNEKLTLNKIADPRLVEPAFFDRSRLTYHFDARDYVWNFVSGKSGSVAFDMFGFTQAEDFYSQLKLKIPSETIQWQWDGKIDKPLTLSVSGFNKEAFSRSGSMNPLARNMLDRAQKSTTNSIKNKNLNLIERAKKLLPFSK